jgi:hypothetical protein
MPKYLLFILAIATSCKNEPKNCDPISSWVPMASIPNKEIDFLETRQSHNWITFSYKEDVYVTNEDSSIPKPINIHKAGLENIVGCRAEKGSRSIEKIQEGYLVGFDCGEFGGSLCLFSDLGNYLYEISNKPVLEIVNSKGRYFGISDLTYPKRSDSSSIIEIKKQGSKWIAEKYLDLPSYALVA